MELGNLLATLRIHLAATLELYADPEKQVYN